MSWLRRKRLGAFLKTSLWVIPVFAMLAAMICAPLTRYLNDALTLPFLNFGLQGARAAMGIIAASMLTFVVFFFSVLLLTVQIASGSLSPRIIARPFQSRVLKRSLGLFVFTFVYATSVLGRLEEHVLQLPVLLVLLLSVLSIGVFLFVVEHISKELRPVTVVTSVAREGALVIQSSYPHPWASASSLRPAHTTALGQHGFRTVSHSGRPGVIVAFDVEGLAELAERNACAIELLPQVGDFVPAGGPLFRVFGGGSISDAELRASIALGVERTLEQDPAFAFRIIVDIAEKALSPAINDPTTGVLAIDQIQFLLQEVGKRDLIAGAVRDSSGELRLVYRTPGWEDFVLLAVAEIRQYGANSIQIMRRLRAMLEDLISLLPPERAPELQQQLDLLHKTVEREFNDSPDREQAEIPDSQGLGGRLASF
ncbi:MAG TPA: DUF2254 domain-containing protein [Bryobacteraceae bacterium]|jgi:uncharacterized membrane protein